jgi:hypothetical protein
MSDERPLPIKKKKKKLREEFDLGAAEAFNANPNINNPFLVTSYAQPYLGNLASNDAVAADIESATSSILGQLSSFYNLDFSSFTLGISTIVPAPTDEASTITMDADIITIYPNNELNLYCDGGTYVLSFSIDIYSYLCNIECDDTFNVSAGSGITFSTPLVYMDQDAEIAENLVIGNITTTNILNATTANINQGFYSSLTGSSIIVNNVKYTYICIYIYI